MHPLRTQAVKGHTNLLKAVNLSADEMQAYSDRIQKLAKHAPELTALCDFTATIQVRRLLKVPPKSWQVLEVRWCGQMLARMAELKKTTGDAATLALVCLGHASDELPAALAILENPPQTEAENPVPVTSGKARSKAAPPLAPPLLSLKRKMGRGEEDELDPETEAQLAKLKKQVEAEAGA